MISGHGGNIYDLALRLGCSPDEIVDMSSNLNPLGPPEGLNSFLKENLKTITALPEVDAGSLLRVFARQHGIDYRNVLAGNGTTQFIYSIPKAMKIKRALIFGPAYADYTDACKMQQVAVSYFMAEEKNSFVYDLDQVDRQIDGNDTVFICNPNNPTGVLIDPWDLRRICRRHPATCFIIDESYLPFVENADEKSMIRAELSNVVVLNSMSKIFRIPGLRIGFIIASDKIIENFRSYLLPWNVNSLAQAAAKYLINRKTEVDTFIKKSVTFLENERRIFSDAVKEIPDIRLFPSTTSFILAELTKQMTADMVCTALSREKILIRNCSNFVGLSDRFIRFSLKTRDINLMVARKLAAFNKA